MKLFCFSTSIFSLRNGRLIYQEGRFERGVLGRSETAESIHGRTKAQLSELAVEIESPRLQRWEKVRMRAESDQRFRVNLARGFDLSPNAPLSEIQPLWFRHEKLRDARRLGLPDDATDTEIFAEIQRRDQGRETEGTVAGL